MNYIEEYNRWCSCVEDPTLTQELRGMSEQERMEAFGGELEFGTAGLRGVMSAGTARMNIYTVWRATEGLARYMDAHGYTSCAITYDSRNNSKRFCELAAATLAGHNVTVYLTPECMPTPYVSFLIRYLHCDVGVNVTASHNPSEYNGYKVYDSEGCQLLDDAACEVTRYIDMVRLFEAPLPVFEGSGRYIKYTDELLEEKYIDSVLKERLGIAPDGLKVVYSPLNGAGYRIVPETLRRAGLTHLDIVPEQAFPDGDFPTCPYPNPEKAEALAAARGLAEERCADLVIANDPDCDRLGVAVRCEDGYRQLTGNEVGVLLADCILSALKQQNRLPKDPILVKTIVTTPLLDAIAAEYGAEVRNVLTGFKYIGNVISKLEKQSCPERFVFGFEESCGYLKGSYVRDKDGVVAALLLAECAAALKAQGKTLCNRLDDLAQKHGHYLQTTVSYRFDGLSGAEDKERLLALVRQQPLAALGSSPVTDKCDFLTQTQYDLPKADVLRLRSADGSQLIIRPSGTEPLIKCYITVKGTEESNAQRLAAIKGQADALFGK